MNVNFQNQICQLYLDKTSNSHNDFHQSNENSEDENENRTLMIAENEEVEPEIHRKNSKSHRKSENEKSISAGKEINITTFDKRSKMTDNSANSGIFESQTNEDSEVKEKKYKSDPKQQYISNKITMQSPLNQVFERKSKRKIGKPEKCFFVNEEFDNEPIIKKSRGRPKKNIEKIEIKEKKPVGRPRIYCNIEPKEKSPIGRPIRDFHLKINKDKRSPGRPRRDFHLKINKEKISPGRPRRDFHLKINKEKRSPGRPRRDFHLKINKEKISPGRPRRDFHFKIANEKKPRGRPRANLQLKFIKEKRSRGRPRRNFDSVIKEKKPRGRPKSNFKLLVFSKQKIENLETIRKRGRPKKLILSECNNTLVANKRNFKDLRCRGDTNKVVKLASTGNSGIPMRKRGRPKKIEKECNSPDRNNSVNFNDIKLEKI